MTADQLDELKHRARKESDKQMADFYAWISMQREAREELAKLLDRTIFGPRSWSAEHVAYVVEATARLALLNAAMEYQSP